MLKYSRPHMYDPSSGRFLGEDPMGFSAGDFNLNRYAGNAATSGRDPSGMDEPDNKNPQKMKSTLGENSLISNLTAGLKFSAKVPDTVRMYRVEGDTNTRIVIDGKNNLRIIGKRGLYVTFGDTKRVDEYFAQKIGPGQKLGPLPGAVIKSGLVHSSFVDQLRLDAITELELSRNPTLKGRPLIADPYQTDSSFGLRSSHIKELDKYLIKGSGKSGLPPSSLLNKPSINTRMTNVLRSGVGLLQCLQAAIEPFMSPPDGVSLDNLHLKSYQSISAKIDLLTKAIDESICVSGDRVIPLVTTPDKLRSMIEDINNDINGFCPSSGFRRFMIDFDKATDDHGSAHAIVNARNNLTDAQSYLVNFVDSIWGSPNTGRIEVNREKREKWEMVNFYFHTDNKVSIEFHTGFLSAIKAGGIRHTRENPAVYANRQLIDTWELWELIDNNDNTFSFKTMHGYFLTSEGNGSGLSTDRRILGEWEKFTIENLNGKNYLRSHTGKYLSSQLE